MLPFERVSLDLATLCGSIPLDNFLANDYDNSGELDYREFTEKADIRYQEDLESHSEESQHSDGEEGDAVEQMLLDDGEHKEDGFARRGSRLHGSEEEGSRTLSESPSLASKLVVDGEAGIDPLESIREAALEKLHMACTRFSGTVEALRFEFIEESPTNIQCILTVTIPTHAGTSTRCYTTSSEFTRRSDAKGEAARIAIDMDAIGFLKSASSANILRDRTALNAHASEKSATEVDIQAGMKARQDIDRMCKEWRVDVTPDYTLYKYRKGKDREIGCALRISLTPHVKRVFSTNTDFSDPEVAKSVCALIALEEGVMDFIMHGNGQKSKPQPKPEMQQPLSGAPVPTRQVSSYVQMSVQEFFDALPRPFVEPIEDGKLASDIQWANMLNMIIQGAKMHGLKTLFHFTDTETRTGLTGCVLRVVISDPSVLSIVSPDGKEVSKTYVVDPHFVKANDAKTAACMVAITEDLRGYLSKISQTYEQATKHSRELDRKVSEATFRVIMKIMKGKPLPAFEYTGSIGSKPNRFGCSLSVNISSDPEAPNQRTFSTTNSQYGSKPDARIAALVEAAKQGIVELLLFRPGEKRPLGYRNFWDVVSRGGTFDIPSTKHQDKGSHDTNSAPKAQRKKRKRANVQKLPLKLDTGKAASANSRPAQPAGDGGEPGEISDTESPPPSKRVAPPKIIRSSSNLSNQPQNKLPTEPKRERPVEGGAAASLPNPKRRHVPPVLRRPPSQHSFHERPNSTRGFDRHARVAQSHPRAHPPRQPHDGDSYPLSYSRPDAYRDGPPPEPSVYPNDSAYPPPSHYRPTQETSDYRSPYTSQPPTPYYRPPSPHPPTPYGYPHPPSPSAGPRHTYSPYDYPDPHPRSTERHDFDTHDGFYRDPPSRHTYPYDGYPAHMIPRDPSRTRDHEAYYRDDYSIAGVESPREYWSRRDHEDPRYYDARSHYGPPPDIYPP